MERRGTFRGHSDLFAPANISPLVVYLATEKFEITGRVCTVQGQAISQLAGRQGIETIETDWPWLIDDFGARLPS